MFFWLLILNLHFSSFNFFLLRLRLYNILTIIQLILLLANQFILGGTSYRFCFKLVIIILLRFFSLSKKKSGIFCSITLRSVLLILMLRWWSSYTKNFFFLRTILGSEIIEIIFLLLICWWIKLILILLILWLNWFLSLYLLVIYYIASYQFRLNINFTLYRLLFRYFRRLSYSRFLLDLGLLLSRNTWYSWRVILRSIIRYISTIFLL